MSTTLLTCFLIYYLAAMAVHVTIEAGLLQVWNLDPKTTGTPYQSNPYSVLFAAAWPVASAISLYILLYKSFRYVFGLFRGSYKNEEKSNNTLD